MAQRSPTLLRVMTGRGIIPLPGWLEQFLTSFDRHQKTIDIDSISDSQLQDIGLTRADIEAEIRRPAWDAPLHWRSN